ncbi:MAG: hypothetical protein AMXMBFR33_13970 [Candidatus Xenobia bacterium]
MIRLLAWLVAVVGVAAASAQPLPASDTWWLLASGRFLAQTGQVVAPDPFSFTGTQWLNHEWLFALAAYEIHRVSSWEGLYLSRTLILVLAYALIPLFFVRKSVEASWAVSMLACLYAWLPPARFFYDVRPYLATYLLTALTLALVRAYLARPARSKLAASVVLTALWANLHGAFILGPGILLVAGLGCLLEKRRPQATELGGAAVLALAAAVANPYGVAILSFPFSLFGESAFRLGLNEWVAPAMMGAHAWFWLVLVLGLGATGLHWRAGDRALALLTLAFLLGGLLAWRNLPLACLAGVQLHQVVLRARAGLRLALLGLVLALELWWGWQRLTVPPARLGMWHTHFPMDAVSFLQANPELPRRLVNPYEWGGWLAWHLPGWQIFIDGRAHTVYSEEVYLEALAIQLGGPWEKKAGVKWQEILDLYKVDLVLATHLQGDLPRRLESSKEWELVYSDSVAAVFLRRGSHHGPLRYPDTPSQLIQKGLLLLQVDQFEPAITCFRQAVQADPGRTRARLYLGVTMLQLGQPEGADELEQALRLDPSLLEANYNLGLFYASQGDQQRARHHFQAELRLNPGHAGARQKLR